MDALGTFHKSHSKLILKRFESKLETEITNNNLCAFRKDKRSKWRISKKRSKEFKERGDKSIIEEGNYAINQENSRTQEDTVINY